MSERIEPAQYAIPEAHRKTLVAPVWWPVALAMVVPVGQRGPFVGRLVYPSHPSQSWRVQITRTIPLIPEASVTHPQRRTSVVVMGQLRARCVEVLDR